MSDNELKDDASYSYDSCTHLPFFCKLRIDSNLASGPFIRSSFDNELEAALKGRKNSANAEDNTENLIILLLLNSTDGLIID